MKETKNLISIDWYRPMECLSPSANMGIGRVLVRLCGRDTVKLLRSSRAKTVLSTKEYEENYFNVEEARAINDRFLQSAGEVYDLDEAVDRQMFFMQQSKGAIKVPEYYRNLVPELASEFEQKEEVTRLSERATDLLDLLYHPADRRLFYEAQRHAVLVYHLGLVNARTLKARLLTLSSDVQDLLGKYLFQSPRGYGERIIAESYHDDDTNAVVGFPGRTSRPLTAHLKRIPIWVRNIPEVGMVHISGRKKDDCVAMVKSWVKAKENGGFINIDEAVQDSWGVLIVLMEANAKPQEVRELVISKMKSGIKQRQNLNHSRKVPQIMKIVEDNETGHGRGQSFKPTFDNRCKISFEGKAIPLELQISTYETYLNSKYEVGVRNRGSGLYDGRAHPLFELRRAIDGIDVAFPKEIFPVSDSEITNAFINTSKQRAYGLRAMHKAG
ncbi:hypothetical protein HYU95_05310 [Candidatus Daviesbacteria bacterium]|nr:hypothetical protein [Candidatus Daviesbacteria bacterium]